MIQLRMHSLCINETLKKSIDDKTDATLSRKNAQKENTNKCKNYMKTKAEKEKF
jgi:hypothetical protein